MTAPETSKRFPQLGVLSLGLAVLIPLMWWSESARAPQYGSGVGPLVVLLGIPVGIVLGVLSLRRKEPKRALAIAGVALNGLYLLLIVLAGLFLLAFLNSDWIAL